METDYPYRTNGNVKVALLHNVAISLVKSMNQLSLSCVRSYVMVCARQFNGFSADTVRRSLFSSSHPLGVITSH